MLALLGLKAVFKSVVQTARTRQVVVNGSSDLFAYWPLKRPLGMRIQGLMNGIFSARLAAVCSLH